MDSIISALYNGDLHLNKSHADENSDEAMLKESFQQTVEWLLTNTKGETEREWLNDLSGINKRLVEQVSFDKFREGFSLGMSLAMEAFCGSRQLEN